MMKKDVARYAHIRALLIDIDDTIVRRKASSSIEPGAAERSLLRVLEIAGRELSGLSAEEVARRMRQVEKNVSWWHWSDFIVALDLDPSEFWRFALEIEREYLEPTGPEIAAALDSLQLGGIFLYVASNNPSSGILHKLAISGMANIHGTTLFHQLLGCNELHAMKWEPIFWKKALAHIGFRGAEVAVIGDNPTDDCAIPLAVGISHSFLIDRTMDRSGANTSNITHVQNFQQIADLLLHREEIS